MIQESITFRELILQMFRTHMAFRRTVQRVLKKTGAGITFEMLQVLHCLLMEDGINQEELAVRIAKGKAASSNLIGNLEKKKLVYRKEDASDRRSKLVYLTEDGISFYNRISPFINDIYLSAGQVIGEEKISNMLADLKYTCDVLARI